MKSIPISLVVLVLLLAGCGAKTSKPLILASTPPLAAILQELTGPGTTVESLLPPGASPHTYSPRPSDIKKIESARSVFFVSPLLDAWSVNYPGVRKTGVLSLLPKDFVLKFEDGSADDPHFWTDPMAVKAMLPALVEKLSAINPGHAREYRDNAIAFSKRLDSLNASVESILAPVKGKTVFLFHPSFRYFLKRYGLIYGGAIEPSPGKEPSPRDIARFIDKIKASGVGVIYTEPQFTEVPARSIAGSAGVALAELDPLGGSGKRKSYFDLIIYNAKVIAGEANR